MKGTKNSVNLIRLKNSFRQNSHSNISQFYVNFSNKSHKKQCKSRHSDGFYIKGSAVNRRVSISQSTLRNGKVSHFLHVLSGVYFLSNRVGLVMNK